MKKKSIFIIILMAGITGIISCNKFSDVNPPKTQLLVSQAFLKDNSATSAVLGIYTNMANDNYLINGGVTVYAGMSADELIQFYQDPTAYEFALDQINPTNDYSGSIWTSAYQNMAQINTCITGLEASTSLTASVKSQLLGEAKFCRAYYNFYLVNLFGNIPLVMTTDYSKNSVIAQSKPADIYNAIIADLKDAQSYLSSNYPTTGKVRPNKWAATALLARTYLYINDYANAEIQASAVIASGTYGPLPALNDAFLKGSAEAIWQILPSNGSSATQEGTNFLQDIPYGSADYYLTDNLLNSFEPGDNRKIAWIDTLTDGSGQIYYYPYKYKDVSQYGATTVNEYYIMLRLGEQYLIRAEARAQLGKLPDALSDMNIIRTRAGLANFTTGEKSTLLKALANENRHEFFAEWGHRWLDLKRTRTADAVLSAQKPTWKSTAVYYPIPQMELNIDKNLVQNSGY